MNADFFNTVFSSTNFLHSFLNIRGAFINIQKVAITIVITN